MKSDFFRGLASRTVGQWWAPRVSASHPVQRDVSKHRVAIQGALLIGRLVTPSAILVAPRLQRDDAASPSPDAVLPVLLSSHFRYFSAPTSGTYLPLIPVLSYLPISGTFQPPLPVLTYPTFRNFSTPTSGTFLPPTSGTFQTQLPVLSYPHFRSLSTPTSGTILHLTLNFQFFSTPSSGSG